MNYRSTLRLSELDRNLRACRVVFDLGSAGVRLELHCHSTASDGTDPPGAVARRAMELGIEVFCLTDHDTCAGWDDVVAAAAGGAMRVLRGVELSASEAGKTVHLLVYDVS